MKIFRLLILFSIIFIVLILSYVSYYYFIGLNEWKRKKENVIKKVKMFEIQLNKNSLTDFSIYDLDEEKPVPTVFYDRKGKIVARYSPKYRRLSNFQKTPGFLSQGFIQIEDQQFFKHNGFNWGRILYFTVKNLLSGRIQGGGSTITQQLAKIIFTNHERNLKRKVFELFCTIELEKRFTKEEILKIYLNAIDMGHGVYGIEEACRFYFNHSSAALTLPEAALFIGMNRAPNRYSPLRNSQNAEYIQRVVMRQFVKIGIIDKYIAEDEIKNFWKKFNQQSVMRGISYWKMELNLAPYYIEFVRQLLEKEFTKEQIIEGGMKIHLTLDLDFQKKAEQAILYLHGILKQQNYDYYKEIEHALVSIDPQSGEVCTLVGGKEYSFFNQFNRALNAFRQIGSTVKPFVYASSLEQEKITPFSVFIDEKKTYQIGRRKYTPVNYDSKHKYGESVTIYNALKQSLNTIAIQVTDLIKPKSIADLLANSTEFSRKSKKKRLPNVLSIGVGAASLSPLELAAAYSIFPRLGKPVRPYFVQKIIDRYDNTLFEYDKKQDDPYNPEPINADRQLISQDTAYQILTLMFSVFEPGGTGYYPARKVNFSYPACGKSGTSDNYRDGWFAGFTQDLVTVAWTGFDDQSKSTEKPGSTTSGVIWTKYMKNVLSSLVMRPYPLPPQELDLVYVNTETGKITDTSQKGLKNIVPFYLSKEQLKLIDSTDSSN